MTSINAVRFDEYSGILICDEQRSWNDDKIKIFSSDKIKPVTPERVQREQGVAVCYGNTGTSSVGDELKFTIKKRISQEYEKLVEKLDEIPEHFKTMEELAQLAFETQIQMKREHINETFMGRYGFNTNDFINGFYKKDGDKIEIKDKEIVNAVHDSLYWKDRSGEMTPIFLNAGIFAGYEPKEGFRIFGLSLIEFSCEPVQEIFLCDGSGRDQTSVVFTEYTSSKILPERRGNIDRVEGLITAIKAVNKASWHNIGVGGYYNIIYIDGRKPNMEKLVEISDHRSKLAAEMVLSMTSDFISCKDTSSLIEELIYNGGTFDDVHEKFMQKVKEPKKVKKFLRGYRV
jgi:hypothetical protein